MTRFSPTSSPRVLHGLLLIHLVSLMLALSAKGDRGFWGRMKSWPSAGIHGSMGTGTETPFVAHNVEGNPIREVVDEDTCDDVQRTDFKEDFAFGIGTAAFEIEGSTVVGGKGPSIWEVFIDEYPERSGDGSNVCTAADSYRRYKEDVQLLVELGVKYYRFSISWPRILPGGSLCDGIRQEGIDHYNSLIDELIKHGIEPVVTLLHFDLPQALQEKYGGFLSSNIVRDFKDYAEICFREFGDRVKKWITINEPFVMAAFGYDAGTAPPGRCTPPACPAGNSSTEPYIVGHNVLLAHATVYRLYNELFRATQKGEVGISHVGQYPEPYDSESDDDHRAAKRAIDFMLGWFVEPLVYGHYPQSMTDLVKERLPAITETEKTLFTGAYDFIGINYYTSRFAKNVDKPVEPTTYQTDSFADLVEYNASGEPIGPQAEGDPFIYMYPKGLQKLMETMKDEYQHPPIYITENGVAQRRNDSLPISVLLNDTERINYTKSHLCYLHRAIEAGVDVKGYFAWSLLDDYEFGDGYELRFGFFFVDYQNNLTRTAKDSVKWYNQFINGGTAMYEKKLLPLSS